MTSRLKKTIVYCIAMALRVLSLKAWGGHWGGGGGVCVGWGWGWGGGGGGGGGGHNQQGMHSSCTHWVATTACANWEGITRMLLPFL